MSDPSSVAESSEHPAHLVNLASELRRLGHAVLSREVDAELAKKFELALQSMADDAETRPRVSKADNVLRRSRIQFFIDEGRWPEPPPNGSRMEFDPASVVGGELNPFSMEAEYYRDGDEAIGRVNLGPCFEGPPERAHGGVICAIFDEVLGSVFRAMGTASAFTGELSVRFEKPAPLNTDLEFRGRLVESQGRRRMMTGEAHGPDGQFASAKATFIEMKPERFVLPDQDPEGS